MISAFSRGVERGPRPDSNAAREAQLTAPRIPELGGCRNMPRTPGAVVPRTPFG